MKIDGTNYHDIYNGDAETARTVLIHGESTVFYANRIFWYGDARTLKVLFKDKGWNAQKITLGNWHLYVTAG